MKRSTPVKFCFAGLLIAVATGCYYNGNGIPYVAVEYPVGPMDTSQHGRFKKFTDSRSGTYFMNDGFRPAPDVREYLEMAQQRMGADSSVVMRNADVRFATPIIVPLPPWGFQFQAADGLDMVTVNRGLLCK